MDWTEVWKGAVLGIVQGLTEFLPVSSSGHLIAFKEVLGFQEADLTFDVALHVATLAAVLFYFAPDIRSLLTHPRRVTLLAILAVGTVPAVALGLALGEWRDSPSPWFVVGGWTFSATYLLLSRGRGGSTSHDEVRWRQGIGIGCAQALALFPGVSRAGSSITCGLWLGLSREAAARFSFLLSIPAIAGAGSKKGYDLYRSGQLGQEGVFGTPLLVGMACAFVVGLVAIYLLMRVLRGNHFHRFGWYNLAAAIAFATFLLVTRS